jgi:hypothetical protein
MRLINEGRRTSIVTCTVALGIWYKPNGKLGGAFYIPGNSNLLFDIEILGKVEKEL